MASARSPGAEPLSGDQAGKPPLKLKHFLLLNVQWKRQIRPFFWNLETQKTIEHCRILQFLLKNGKKRTFSYKVACKKFSRSGQRGGHRTVASPKYATDPVHPESSLVVLVMVSSRSALICDRFVAVHVVEDFVILACTVLIQSQSVTETRTDGQTDAWTILS